MMTGSHDDRVTILRAAGVSDVGKHQTNTHKIIISHHLFKFIHIKLVWGRSCESKRRSEIFPVKLNEF